jgi:peptide/nickel transport system substrate-binding protein
MGQKTFTITPVGAGPFEAVSDTLSSELVLKKNPHYWQKGLPYLDSLTFKDTSTDETALEALQANGAQAYKDMTSPQLVSEFQPTSEETASPYDVQMNTKTAPFNDKLAREALYYAVNPSVLVDKLFGGVSKPVEGFTAPGGLFYDPTVPGYRTYNLAKAKAIVKQLGGLSFGLIGGETATSEKLAEGLQTMWEEAGMKVAQMFRFLSTSPFSGVHDPKLDALLNQATEVPEPQRGAVYQQASDYESQQAF